MRRSKMSRRASRRDFGRNANRTHKRNIPPAVLRGGIRL